MTTRTRLARYSAAVALGLAGALPLLSADPASAAPTATIKPTVSRHVLLPTKVIDLRKASAAAAPATAASVTEFRQPSSGSYNCGGIPLAWYHQTEPTSNGTAHRISAYYGGTGVTKPSTTQTHFDLVHVTFREQDATHSLGGEDYYLSDNSGFWDSSTSLSTAPWHVGSTYFAIRIDYVEGITKYTQPCTYLI